VPVNEACGNAIVVTELNAQETVTFLSVCICVCYPIRAVIAQQGAVVLIVKENVLGKVGSSSSSSYGNQLFQIFLKAPFLVSIPFMDHNCII